MWIQHCSIVHAKVLDETTFEELNKLREEVNKIKFTLEYRDLVDSKEIISINDLQSLLAAKIKGWLFNYYSVSGDFQKYDEVNERLRRYLWKVKESNSSEDITYRNLILMQRRNQERY